MEGRPGYQNAKALERGTPSARHYEEEMMPALLARVLSMFGAGALARTAGRAVLRRPALAASVVGGAGLAAFGAQQALTMGGGAGMPGMQPRRRRRRALTADDMRTALTIASAISKKAAENFVLQRTRR